MAQKQKYHKRKSTQFETHARNKNYPFVVKKRSISDYDLGRLVESDKNAISGEIINTSHARSGFGNPFRLNVKEYPNEPTEIEYFENDRGGLPMDIAIVGGLVVLLAAALIYSKRKETTL